LTNRNIIISEERLRRRVAELADEISRDYAGQTVDLVCLTNSASMFCSDLVRKSTVPAKLHFLSFASYSQGSASGEVRITLDVAEPLRDRHVIVVEGIVVSGRTPRYVVEILKCRQPASIVMCALGTKPAQLAVDLPLRYVAFELGSEIAVGYGVGSGPDKTLPYLVEAAQ
jgi:hypoxanthine phosphoribosyltransferase